VTRALFCTRTYKETFKMIFSLGSPCIPSGTSVSQPSPARQARGVTPKAERDRVDFGVRDCSVYKRLRPKKDLLFG